RHEALNKLATGLVKKSENIERILNSFENFVERVIETAEGRTRDSAEGMRNAITEIVESATSRFSGATEEMRRTAAAIRAELEQTRAEMKKGVFELPEEAKESTSAMRRAITEQVNALKELSEIVAKSGRLHDASQGNREAVRPAPSAPAAAPRASSADNPAVLEQRPVSP